MSMMDSFYNKRIMRDRALMNLSTRGGEIAPTSPDGAHRTIPYTASNDAGSGGAGWKGFFMESNAVIGPRPRLPMRQIALCVQ
jgi:hypothetical protein